MSDSLTSVSESNFVCACDDDARSACTGEPFYKKVEDKSYCVLHFPGKEKSADFKRALQKKLENKNFNFCGVWFPDEVLFKYFEFSPEVYFRSATFSAGANFSGAQFRASAVFDAAVFSEFAYFSSATFTEGGSFRSVTFKRVPHFNNATFTRLAGFNFATFSEGADFSFTTFKSDVQFPFATVSGRLDFFGATFSGEVNFVSATLADLVRFAGHPASSGFTDTAWLDMKFATIEKPDRVSFHTLTLRPSSFVNFETRKLDFLDVTWRFDFADEIKGLKQRKVPAPYVHLAKTLRALAINCEENHRYEHASTFRYWAMDTTRRESWRGFAFWRLSWWYWLASGYGERILRAFVVLLGIWFVAGLLYTRVGFARWESRIASETDIATAKKDDVGAPLPFIRALTYSAGVLTFQKPEPKPATTAAHALVLLETILGPVQAALLALAIRRKFMR